MSVPYEYSITNSNTTVLSTEGAAVYNTFVADGRIIDSSEIVTDNGDGTVTYSGTITFLDQAAYDDYFTAIEPYVNRT